MLGQTTPPTVSVPFLRPPPLLPNVFPVPLGYFVVSLKGVPGTARPHILVNISLYSSPFEAERVLKCAGLPHLEL